MLFCSILITVIRFQLSYVSRIAFFTENCFYSAMFFRQKAYIIHAVWFLVMQGYYFLCMCVSVLSSSLSSSCNLTTTDRNKRFLLPIFHVFFQLSPYNCHGCKCFCCLYGLVYKASAYNTDIKKRYAFDTMRKCCR